MAIPDFQSLMVPLLRHLGDGEARSNQQTLEALAVEFRLTPEERAQLLPSGRQALFTNRVAWAKAHLKKAGLLESVGRGVYRITERGQAVLKQNLARLDMKYLRRFPGYTESGTAQEKHRDDDPTSSAELTPLEQIAAGYEQVRDALAVSLLEEIRKCPPVFFEQLVVDLLVGMGYGGSREDAGEAVGRSGDGGIDGIIKEDRLGLDAIYLQAKRWESVVSRPEIQKFAGALQGLRARRGVFITTSGFSKDARAFAASIETRIVLIDGEELASLMIDHGIGVTEVASYVVKRIDSDYFAQE